MFGFTTKKKLNNLEKRYNDLCSHTDIQLSKQKHEIHQLRKTLEIYRGLLSDARLAKINCNKLNKQLYDLALAQREWIDAVPDHTPLPTMPGHSREWANKVLSFSRQHFAENSNNRSLPLDTKFNQLALGSHLPTRDGRKKDNCYVINTLYPPNDPILSKNQEYVLITKTGEEFTLTAKEVEDLFYLPNEIVDVLSLLQKFKK